MAQASNKKQTLYKNYICSTENRYIAHFSITVTNDDKNKKKEKERKEDGNWRSYVAHAIAKVDDITNKKQQMKDHCCHLSNKKATSSTLQVSSLSSLSTLYL